MTATYSNTEFRKSPSQFPGYYEIKSLKINGTDVIGQMVQLDVYEDLTSPTMTGTMTVVDTTNLIRRIPIVGEEELEVTISDQYAEIDLRFVIYKISDRQQLNFGVMSYNLHFCSREMYVDSFKRVSKAYDNFFYEDAVIDVKENYLDSRKELLIAPTKYRQCFILPNWNPLAAISWMASRSVADSSDYSPGNFLFFEEKDRFNFISLENLMDDRFNRVFSRVALDPMRPTKDNLHAYDGRMPDDTMRFESYQIAKSFNVLENSAMGMYKNRLKTVDIVDRYDEDWDYDYLRDFERGTHLRGRFGEANPLASRDNLATKDDLDTETRVAVKHRGLFTNEDSGGHHVEEWYNPRISQMMQTENFKIVGTLPGQLELKVGMLLHFDLPRIEDISVNTDQLPDLLYSGNYLVTSLRRTFKKDKCYCTVEMIRDSLSLTLSGTQV